MDRPAAAKILPAALRSASCEISGNETDPALGAGDRFQTAGAGHLDGLTGGLNILADAGFCSTEEITKILQTVDSVRRFCQNS